MKDDFERACSLAQVIVRDATHRIAEECGEDIGLLDANTLLVFGFMAGVAERLAAVADPRHARLFALSRDMGMVFGASEESITETLK